MPAGLDNLKHIVVLMMSGRSFDHMLGALKSRDPRIDGLTGNESNPDSGGALVPVQPLAQFQGQLDPTPDSHFPGVDLQVFGGVPTEPGRVANMQGFIKSYFQQQRNVKQSQKIMYYFTPDKLPILTGLATQFAVFNGWFSSIPGPTICNRAFAHYGTSFGQVDVNVFQVKGPYLSIYERVLLAGRTAKLYHYDSASSSMETVNLLRNQSKIFGTFDQFLGDCRSGMLPSYSFVEPNHNDHESDTGMEVASDQRPDHHVQHGEIFINNVYNAIFSNEQLWKSTALLIVYDEHGGIYDHIAPPDCTPDDDGFVAGPDKTETGARFAFDRLGVRVPAILVSPWVPKSSVIPGPNQPNGRTFDHASIPATVMKFILRDFDPNTLSAADKQKFLGQSRREKAADTFLDLLGDKQQPDDDIPTFEVNAGARNPRSSTRRRPPATKVRPRETRKKQVNVAASPETESKPTIPEQPVLKPIIAGYRSDTSSGIDLLDIKKDVRTLCSVLAAKDVEVPVSVGLFGDWGSGKTFFMRQMEKEFNYIRAESQKLKGRTAYCANIVQLWFNAWHYIDKNIWASLAAEIFDGLARAVAQEALSKDEKTKADYEKAQLVAKKAVVTQELAQSLVEKSQTEAKLVASQEQISRFESEPINIADGNYLKAILMGALGFAASQPEVRDAIKEIKEKLDGQMALAASELNVPANVATSSAFKANLLELRGIVGRAKAIVLSIRHSKHPAAWALCLGIVALSVTIAPFAILTANSLSSRLAPVLVALAGGVASVAKFLPLVRRAFKTIEDARDESVRKIDEQRKQQFIKLNNEHAEVRKELAGKQAKVEEKRKELESLDNDLEKLRADRKMMDFIQRRKESSDYKKHLGVIAQAYTDFEQLSLLLAEVRKEIEGESQVETSQGGSATTEGKTNKLLPRIDRIVLYIDDLDRCPEDKVVDVLQAIHLLLFFPLFVVVVGVDSRWLLHSLKQQSRVFQDSAEEDWQAHDIERLHWQSTPLNYLEKIFQIPFTVPLMSSDGFERLVKNLTEQQAQQPTIGRDGAPVQVPGSRESRDQLAATSPAEQQTSTSSTALESSRESPDSAASGAGKIITIEGEALIRTFDPNPQHLRLEECERKFMRLLHPLIPSPRAAKRFVNVYRLVRTSVDEKELAVFVKDDESGEYQAAQLLLAIQTGYPELAMQISQDLIQQRPKKAWWRFIYSYDSRAGQKHSVGVKASQRRDKRVAGRRASQRVEAEQWQELFGRLDLLRENTLKERLCDDFVKWAPRVARYSFRSTPLLRSGQPNT